VINRRELYGSRHYLKCRLVEWSAKCGAAAVLGWRAAFGFAGDLVGDAMENGHCEYLG